MKLAERISRIDSSGIRKVFALAAEMKDPCNLSIGQPHFDVPDPIKEVGVEAIKAGKNRYTQTGGNPSLKDKVRAKLASKKTIETDGVLITSGTSGGIFLSFMALFNEGDEVICPDPYFVMYKHLLNLMGIKPVYVDLYPDFRMTREKVEPKITDRTKGILLNSPANPTGTVATREDLEGITVLAREKDLIVISDEIYDLFVYDDPFLSIGDLYENCLILGGFSKTYSMTGWRLGYAVGPADLIKAMEELQQYSFVCAPSVGQAMAEEALDFDMTPFREEYAKKRDLIYDGLKNDFDVEKPGGAFYIFPKAPNGDGDAFVAEAIKNDLLIVPGSVFSEKKTHFRISFAAEEATLKRGIEILKRLGSN
ncbi:MAG: aminotransferase class I/II-fold pyridoxal phosphate-dependent enzyme [Candidatus Omnitrophica bacterium]|nr:aminotransferase class I/II-fold pyridoxal phosphate-dependent enzyme [Candidatus Omnitrophota bacterium]